MDSHKALPCPGGLHCPLGTLMSPQGTYISESDIAGLKLANLTNMAGSGPINEAVGWHGKALARDPSFRALGGGVRFCPTPLPRPMLGPHQHPLPLANTCRVG